MPRAMHGELGSTKPSLLPRPIATTQHHLTPRYRLTPRPPLSSLLPPQPTPSTGIESCTMMSVLGYVVIGLVTAALEVPRAGRLWHLGAPGPAAVS